MRPLFDERLVAGVRHHHERFDGKGYPDVLSGTDIPLVARALCVVDCYDAMSCERPYRHALSYKQCCAELRRCSGTQFDPDMVAAFLVALRRLQRKRTRVAKLACQAAQLNRSGGPRPTAQQRRRGAPGLRANDRRLAPPA